MRSKKGFTLIELLIVIAVIGILASAVLIGLGPVQKRGRDARRVSDLRQTQNALELYNTKYTQYPDATDWDTLTTTLTDPTTGVVNVLPNDPLGSRDPADKYQYGVNATHDSYTLRATLEDTSSNILKGSVHGSDVNGQDCGAVDDTNGFYCVQL